MEGNKSIYFELDKFIIDRKYARCSQCSWTYPVEDIPLGVLLSVSLRHLNAEHRKPYIPWMTKEIENDKET